MKNRRFVIVAFMLVAVLTMSIGFAAYSTTLAIHGTTAVSAEAIEFTEKVIFIDAESSNVAYGTAAVADDGKSASFAVTGMTERNETVQFTYTIENTSDYDVSIEITTHPTPAKASKCTVTTSLGSNIIPKNSTITATVSVVMNETVTTVQNPIAWTIEYTALSIEP